ncbi:MAG: DoxX family protein [Actinomycetota bacterium]|nr:DoxX family protein [Actinomycetota bacterium]
MQRAKGDDMLGRKTITPQACSPWQGRSADLGLLALRATAGGLLAGHGAQKLFGAFGGHGLQGTAGWLESLGLRPGKAWATLAGLSEFGGGALTALGLGGPLGPIALQGAMATAARQAHWNKPIWVTEGGAELPVLYSATGIALALAGPGRYSLDRALGLRVPAALSAVAATGVVAGVLLAERRTASAQGAQPAAEEAVMAGPEGGEDTIVESETTGLVAEGIEDRVIDAPADDGAAWADDVPPFEDTVPHPNSASA